MQKPFPWPLLLIGFAIWYFANSGSVPSPLPTPPPPDGPNFIPAFRSTEDKAQAREHALALASICEAIADHIEYDAAKPDPRLKTGVQLDDLRLTTREYRMKGWSFGTTYPDLGPAMNSYLTAAVGTSGGPLTPEQRTAWVKAFRTLHRSAEYAANNL